MPWYGEERKAAIRRTLGARLLAALQAVQARHRQNVGRQYPPASRPGQYPARRSGTLQAAVDFEPGTVDELATTLNGTVYYRPSAPYSKRLAASGRLSIKDTVRAMRGELRAIVEGGGG
jgi:hypothetical protein